MIMSGENMESQWPEWRIRLNKIIFGTDTREGRLFDILLLVVISLSVLVVFLDSFPGIHEKYGKLLNILEWIFTVIFTIEYMLRIYTSYKPYKYILSFYGIIDLIAFSPTYLSLFVTGGQFLIVLRVFRLLRVFRIFNLSRFLWASSTIMVALRNSRHKIAVFLWFIIIIVVIMGVIMFLVEGPENGFRNIPESIYWAVVTLTTVGYGDISPQTGLGKFIASLIMIIGYGVIAVPTGIFSAEMSRNRALAKKQCEHCQNRENDADALYCKKCGNSLKTS